MPERAREWILRDKVHQANGALRRAFATAQRDRADA